MSSSAVPAPRRPMTAPLALVGIGAVAVLLSLPAGQPPSPAPIRALPPYAVDPENLGSQAAGGVDGVDGQSVATGTPAVDASDRLVVTGWTADLERRRPICGVIAFVDGGTRFWLPGGGHRPDVADVLEDPSLVSSGFGGSIDVTSLRPGRHVLTTRAITCTGAGYLKLQPRAFSSR